MQRLVVIENRRHWPLDVPGAEVVPARDYLTDARFSGIKRARVFNLCRSYGYQSIGYYVSLLAEARGHRPLPSVTTIQDPAGILRHEWVNARGCIARFDRMAIEIRVVDAQECPRADLAVAAAIVALVRALVEERWSTYEAQRAWTVDRLSAVLDRVIEEGDQTILLDRDYQAALGYRAPGPCTAGDLWGHLLAAGPGGGIPTDLRRALDTILARGCLARRILQATGRRPAHERLAEVYRELCDCLRRDRLFDAA